MAALQVSDPASRAQGYVIYQNPYVAPDLEKGQKRGIAMLLCSLTLGTDGPDSSRLRVRGLMAVVCCWCRADDVQVEFVMLDPYIRTKLQHNDQVRLIIASTSHFFTINLELLLVRLICCCSVAAGAIKTCGIECRGTFTQPSRFLTCMASTNF